MRSIVIISFLLIICAIPNMVAQEYHIYEVSKLQTFLNMPSAVEGKLNGEQLNNDYDENNPETWNGISWTESAPKKVKKIELYWVSLSGPLALSYFDQIDTIVIKNTSISSLDLGHQTNLKYLECDWNDIQTIYLDRCSKLNNIYCSNNKLSSIDISECEELTSLFGSFNNLTSLNCNSNLKLQTLQVDNNDITNLMVENCVNLSTLACGNNKMSFIDVGSLSNLMILSISGNQLTEIDVSQNTGLRHLICQDNYLESIAISSGLYYFNCINNNLDFISLEPPATLSHLDYYFYSPQNLVKIGELIDDTYFLLHDKELDLSRNFDGGKTSYNWKNTNGNNVNDKVESIGDGFFTLDQSLIGDTVFCEMVHPDFPDLQLQTVKAVVKENTSTYHRRLRLNEPEINIYPTPTSKEITIDFSNTGDFLGYQLSIINTAGQQVFSENIKQTKSIVNLLPFKKGMFFLHLKDEKGALIDVKKIILQ